MPKAASARVVIAEPWSILRRGLAGTLHARHTVVDDFDDVSELRRTLTDRKVDVALIGATAGLDLPAVVAALNEGRSDLHVVVLCDHIDAEALRFALQAGASAVLSKKVEGDALLDILDRVLNGERVVDQPFLPLLFEMPDLRSTCPDGAPALLTRRERDVLHELARGATNRAIAEALVMSESTVKTHLRRIYSKLDVTGRHGAVGRALELDLLG